ncbi:MAG: hypothetical protein WC716_10285 [Chitinophagaceae bacterium]|jgi:hypothetical protein
MKKKALLIPIFAFTFLSCKDSHKTEDVNEVVYTGDFAGEPIELTLTNLDDSMVKGESRHKGQVSEMSGKKSASLKGYSYRMKELGTGQYEGEFSFELDTALNIIFGSWQLADTTDRTAILYTLRPKSTH